jgi:hypothetical protein
MLRTVPFLERYGHRIAEALLVPFPQLVLTWITRVFLGMSPDSARITSEFLKSRDGVWQALHMGKDEMKVISDEKWVEELWEIPLQAEEHRHKVPKFMFLFGKHDEWVASHVRDDFIDSRRKHSEREGPAHKRSRTEIEVDEDGALPHAFCTRESMHPALCRLLPRAFMLTELLGSTVVVAERVNKWINQIQESIQSSSGLKPAHGEYTKTKK